MATCNTDSKTFCVLPWMMLETDSNGNVKVCCKSQQNLRTKELKTHLSDVTMEDLWTSDHINEIRQALNNNQYHANCERCWSEENSGALSMRKIFNKAYSHLLVNDLTKPQMLDLKLGIKCNLACRICSMDSSDQWIEETFHFMEPHDVERKTKYVNKIYRAFDKTNDLWQAIDNYMPNLKRLDFYGGEPWLIQEHWDILAKMTELGYSKDCILHYTTNGTVFKQKQVDLLKSFKNVSIQLSIDGIGNRFEYQRYPGKWSVIEKNIERFMRLRDYGIKISTCTTLSNLNIWYVEELLRYFGDRNIQVYFNYLHRPEEFNLTNLPHDVKLHVKERLEKIDSKYTQNLDNISVDNMINWMLGTQDNPVWYKRMAKKLKRHDDYRNENFMEVCPDFVDLLPNFKTLYEGGT